MSEFKVGDRVRVYFGSFSADGTVGLIRNDGSLGVKADEIGATPDLSIVHPKQCRRLVKKTGPVRVWLALPEKMKGETVGTCGFSLEEPHGHPGWFEFVEVRRGK